MVDVVQPVAAVLDVGTGRVRQVVGWARVPPEPAGGSWPEPMCLGDGESLWVQRHRSGPVVRVDLDGVAAAAWTGGHVLTACEPGVAWCMSVESGQEFAGDPDDGRDRRPRADRLLRVAADGSSSIVEVEGRVRDLHGGPDGLWAQIDVAPSRVEHRGSGTWEVVWAQRWLHLPARAPVPRLLSVHEHGVPDTDAPPNTRHDDGGRLPWNPVYEPDRPSPVSSSTRTWFVGQPGDAPRTLPESRVPALASVHRAGDPVVLRRWELGAGQVIAAREVDGHLVVAIDRDLRSLYDPPRAVELVRLDPAADEVRTLLAPGSVDITADCWPLVPEPVEVASYVERVRQTNDGLGTYWSDGTRVTPLSDGMVDATTTLAGSWPDTRLEWTFAHVRAPGLRLRRSVPLFDELGRPVLPEYASIHLMEDLETRVLPAAGVTGGGPVDI